MATLRSNGQELIRLEKEEHIETDTISYRRRTLSFGQKAKLLEKIDVVFRHDGRKHTWGWKVKSRHPGCPVERIRNHYKSLGFKEVT